MLGERERLEIARLWERNLRQHALQLPLGECHRNLDPASAEFLRVGRGTGGQAHAGGRRIERPFHHCAGGRGGYVSGHVTSVEREPLRQGEARKTLKHLGLSRYVEFILGDAGNVPQTAGEFDLVLIDCEKADYIRFFDMLHLPAGGTVVADNIISHSLASYVTHVRARPEWSP